MTTTVGLLVAVDWQRVLEAVGKGLLVAPLAVIVVIMALIVTDRANWRR